MNGEVLIASRGPGIKTLAAGALLLVMAGVVVFAVQHEMRARPESVEKASAFQEAPRRAFSADEERYAQALSNLHDQVKGSAVTMMFAGITYKTGGMNRSSFLARIKPVAAGFSSAQEQFRKLSAPQSMKSVHAEYGEALRLYRGSAEEALKIATDGDDSHLLAAHEMSKRASDLLLKVGDEIWPGEYKPN
jgi:hypothetical protein